MSTVENELQATVAALEQELADEICCTVSEDHSKASEQAVPVDDRTMEQLLTAEEVDTLTKEKLIEKLMVLQELIIGYEPLSKTAYREMGMEKLRAHAHEMRKTPLQKDVPVEDEDEPEPPRFPESEQREKPKLEEKATHPKVEELKANNKKISSTTTKRPLRRNNKKKDDQKKSIKIKDGNGRTVCINIFL